MWLLLTEYVRENQQQRNARVLYRHGPESSCTGQIQVEYEAIVIILGHCPHYQMQQMLCGIGSLK